MEIVLVSGPGFGAGFDGVWTEFFFLFFFFFYLFAV